MVKNQSFIIGSNGYIGHRAADYLRQSGCIVRTVSSRVNGGDFQLDLRAPGVFDYQVMRAEDVVLLGAALSSPDICSREAMLARQVNVIGTAEFIQSCLARGARVVFFSSDTVYGPGRGERDEHTQAKPAGAYAQMKREIEARFAVYPAFKVIRLSYVFSRHDKFTAYLSDCAGKGAVAEIFHPLYRRAVYLDDLLDLLRILCVDWNRVPDRILNIGGPELVSRVDMANLFKEIVAPGLDFKIVEPAAEFFVARPPVINMSNGNFEKVMGRALRSLREAMPMEFTAGAAVS